MDDHSKVHSATLWWAHSCGENAWDNNIKRRDYRIAHLDNPCTCGPYVAGYCINLKTFWHKQELTSTMVKGKRTYVAHMDMPTDGSFLAFFIDFKFAGSHKEDESINVDNLLKSVIPKAKAPGAKKTVKEIVREEVGRISPDSAASLTTLEDSSSSPHGRRDPQHLPLSGLLRRTVRRPDSVIVLLTSPYNQTKNKTSKY